MATEKTLNKYKLVIDEYFVNGFNGTKAYQKFYPESSDETADSNFRSILGNTRIESYVKAKQTAYKRLKLNQTLIKHSYNGKRKQFWR